MKRLRDYQVECIQRLRAEYAAGKRSPILQLPTGGGKCLGRGERVVMFDGTLRKVEELRVGDRLMGPDSAPRTIKRLGKGFGPMVIVRPVKGRAWRCNDVHVLSLVRTETSVRPDGRKRRSDYKGGQIVDVPVDEWREWSKTKRHLHKLFRASVDFPAHESPPRIDPYFLGVLLGDGSMLRNTVKVTTADAEIADELYAQGEKWGIAVRMDDHGGRCPTYHFTGGRQKGKTGLPTPLASAVHGLGLMDCRSGEKFIPARYKTGSRNERLELLAGLIDTDGHFGHNYEYASKSIRLAEDIAFVARSLGFAAYMSRKMIEGIPYYRVGISGDLSQVPVVLPRKKAPSRQQKKDVRRTGFQIDCDGRDWFYGFELDGDGRFLLEDFTVTHNTVIAGAVTEGALERGMRKILILVHRHELAMQFRNTLLDFGFAGQITIIAGTAKVDMTAPIHIGMVQTVVNRLDKLPPYDFRVVDECHHGAAATYMKIRARWPDAKELGMSATPSRLDGKALEGHDAIVCGPSVRQLISWNFLADYQLLGLDRGKGAIAEQQKMKGGDFNMDGVADDNWVADTVSVFNDHCAQRRTLIFCPDCATARKVQGALIADGHDIEYADGAMPKGQRERALGRFECGEAKALVSVDLLGEGYDVPAADCVLMDRPTQSTTVYLQQAGRCLRPNPGGGDSLILDCVGNTQRVGGGPKVPRQWTLDGTRRKAGRKPKGEGEAPTRKKKAKLEVKLIELFEDCSLTIQPNAQGTGWRRASVHAAVKRCRHTKDLERLALSLGYHEGWRTHMQRIFNIPH